MRTLVTGFGPFGPVTDNPSAHLAEGSGRDFEIIEVAYDAVDAFLRDLSPERFDTLLLLGVATRREMPTPEFYARNSRGSVPDVRGQTPEGPIEEARPLLLETTLWTPHLLAGLEIDLNLRLSMDAGNYLCNYTYYRALERFPSKRVGFLHVPPFEKLPQERQGQILSDVLKRIEA